MKQVEIFPMISGQQFSANNNPNIITFFPGGACCDWRYQKKDQHPAIPDHVNILITFNSRFSLSNEHLQIQAIEKIHLRRLKLLKHTQALPVLSLHLHIGPVIRRANIGIVPGWASLFTGTLDSVWSCDLARPAHLQDQYAGFKAAGFTENTLLLIYRNF